MMSKFTTYKNWVNEIFQEESDPIHDMGIGIEYVREFDTYKDAAKFIIDHINILSHGMFISKKDLYIYMSGRISWDDEIAYVKRKSRSLIQFLKDYLEGYGGKFDPLTIKEAGVRYDRNYRKLHSLRTLKDAIYNELQKIYENLSEAVTPTVNKHMTHAEDLVLSGKDGLVWINKIFSQLYNKLKSNIDKSDIKLSIKFDGAPSVFMWSKFRELSRPGVAIKGLFAKDPKVMYTSEDVDKFYSDKPDLAAKLKILLKYVSILGIPENEIWQGDLLFDKFSLKDEGNYYSFHPNTIIYKVKKYSEIGQKIGNSDIGIVWHTRYTGTSLNDIKAQYNTKISELKDNSKVFMTDPYIASVAGYVTLTETENKKIREVLIKVNEASKRLLKTGDYEKIIGDKNLMEIFKIFQNLLIRQNIRITDADEFLKKFKVYISERLKKEIEKKKTDIAKDKLKQEENRLLQLVNETYTTFRLMIKLMIVIRKLKNIFIKKLNNISEFETFLKTKEGKYITTGDEGFAVSDISGNVVKLVDRYDFSYANFSPDIVKSWSK